MKKILLDRRLPGGLTLGAAVLLLLSPPVLGFPGTAAASGYVLAAIVAVIGARTLARPAAWEGWIIAAAGAAVFVMPWILGFGAVAMAVWAHKVLGAVMLAAGALALWEGRREVNETEVVPTFQRKDDGAVGT